MKYDFWQKAIQKTGGRRGLTREELKELQINEDEVGCGFFRRRTESRGVFKPIAIFLHEGELVALLDGKRADAGKNWLWCAPHPVTEAAYRERMKLGVWGDEDTAVTESLAAPPAPGDNNPPEETNEERIARQIDAASGNLKAYAEIKDDETAAKAQSVRSRLLELAGEAEGFHEVEKAPWLEGGRVVDKKWFTLRDAGNAAAKAIRDALKAHENRKRVAREAAEAALAKRASDDAAAHAAAVAKAEAKGKPAPAPPPPAPIPEPVADTPKVVKGAYGRAASVRPVRVAVITDLDKIIAATKKYKEVVAFYQGLADRAAKANIPLDGVEFKEEIDVR